MTRMSEKIRQVDSKTYGMVMNSFLELDPAFIKHCAEVVGEKSWHVGVSLFTGKDVAKMTERGKKSSISPEDCISWLDEEPSFVLYVCFGSICKFAPSQLVETGAALESYGCNFICVIKTTESLIRREKKGQRTGDQGMRSTGCDTCPSGGGRLCDSLLLELCFGRNKHRCADDHVAWVCRAVLQREAGYKGVEGGAEVGVKRQVQWELEIAEVVKREGIEKAIRRVMVGGKEAEETRKRAKELGDMAEQAIEKDGSSYLKLSRLIEELRTIVWHAVGA